jgi:hypothetical protein
VYSSEVGSIFRSNEFVDERFVVSRSRHPRYQNKIVVHTKAKWGWGVRVKGGGGGLWLTALLLTEDLWLGQSSAARCKLFKAAAEANMRRFTNSTEPYQPSAS